MVGPPYCPACGGAALEEAIVREDPETIAAFIAEPVGGSSTGASVPPPDHFRRVREICDRYGVLFVVDEVLVGAGRTGTWSALEPTGVVPDVMFATGATSSHACNSRCAPANCDSSRVTITRQRSITGSRRTSLRAFAG